MRLTRKMRNGVYTFVDNLLEGYEVVGLPITKLGQYEDIEEELGIDLVILFGALKNGVYYFEGNQITHDKVYLYSNYLGVCFDKLSYSFMTFFRGYLFAFKDYGKTWSLDKNDLEKKR